jgi:hypothetical protein
MPRFLAGGNGPPSFGSRPRQEVGASVWLTGNDLRSLRSATVTSCAGLVPCENVKSPLAWMTRRARIGSGPGSGLAIGSKLPSVELRTSTTRSSLATTWGGGDPVRECPVLTAIETL